MKALSFSHTDGGAKRFHPLKKGGGRKVLPSSGGAQKVLDTRLI